MSRTKMKQPCQYNFFFNFESFTLILRVTCLWRWRGHRGLQLQSACNVGDPTSIPGSGRSPGERIGYPRQCSWVSLVAQLIKNPPAMWKPWVRSLGWEDPLEEGKASHSSILAWRIPWKVHGVTKSQALLSDFHFHFLELSLLTMDVVAEVPNSCDFGKLLECKLPLRKQ